MERRDVAMYVRVATIEQIAHGERYLVEENGVWVEKVRCSEANDGEVKEER